MQTQDVESHEPITDDELTALALSADPDADLGEDAVSFWDLAEESEQLLPAWYMPAPSKGTRLLYGWRRNVALLIIVSFLSINAVGLCSTYGWVGLG